VGRVGSFAQKSDYNEDVVNRMSSAHIFVKKGRMVRLLCFWFFQTLFVKLASESSAQLLCEASALTSMDVHGESGNATYKYYAFIFVIRKTLKEKRQLLLLYWVFKSVAKPVHNFWGAKYLG